MRHTGEQGLVTARGGTWAWLSRQRQARPRHAAGVEVERRRNAQIARRAAGGYAGEPGGCRGRRLRFVSRCGRAISRRSDPFGYNVRLKNVFPVPGRLRIAIVATHPGRLRIQISRPRKWRFPTPSPVSVSSVSDDANYPNPSPRTAVPANPGAARRDDSDDTPVRSCDWMSNCGHGPRDVTRANSPTTNRNINQPEQDV
jgi:hypothetical protein